MSRDEVFRCDVCKKPKGETNHWFTGRAYSGSGNALIAIFRWSQAQAREEGVFHLCGEECAQKKVSEFLSAK